MTAKEKVLEQAPDWTEEQAAAALRAAESTSGSILVEDKRPAEPSSDSDEESDELSEDDAMLVGHEAAIERLRADPVAWASWQAEIAELDGTLSDGLGGL
jgi:hypothetical protein